jgi:hypothetical protein
MQQSSNSRRRSPNRSKALRQSPSRFSPQLKMSDTVVAAQACNTTGTIVLLSTVAQGVGIDAHIGLKLQFLRAELHVHQTVTAATGVDQSQRWLLVWDRQPNGALCAIDDVLTTVSTLSGYDVNGQTRFKVLKDVYFTLNAAAEPGSERVWHLTVPIKKQVTFITAGATISAIGSGALLFISIGSQAAGVTAGSFDVTCRTYFHDS